MLFDGELLSDFSTLASHSQIGPLRSGHVLSLIINVLALQSTTYNPTQAGCDLLASFTLLGMDGDSLRELKHVRRLLGDEHADRVSAGLLQAARQPLLPGCESKIFFIVCMALVQSV